MATGEALLPGWRTIEVPIGVGRRIQELARHADEIRLMVAGIALDVKGPGRL